MPLKTGISAEVAHTVTENETAIALHSGDVPVLATPIVVALVEEATVKAVEGNLDAGVTTVGMRVQLDHVQPTRVGTKVTAEATLERIEGRRLIFSVSVSDPCGLIAAGKVTRVLVDVDRFLERAR